MAKVVTTVNIDEELLDALRYLATEKERSVSFLINKCLKDRYHKLVAKMEIKKGKNPKLKIKGNE